MRASSGSGTLPTRPKPATSRSAVLPFTLMSLRMPKYTLLCAPTATLVHDSVAPEPVLVMLLTTQDPPPAANR
jgi:hypothetical protein